MFTSKKPTLQNNVETVTITKETLRQAFVAWERERRDGECRTQEETDALTIAQVADENVEHFWGRLFG